MVIVYVALAVVLVGLLVAVVVQRVGLPGVEPAVTTESFTPLPRGGVDFDEIAAVRFDPALRGYRMSQVDEMVDRLVDEIRLRDAEIARLRGEDPEEPDVDDTVSTVVVDNAAGAEVRDEPEGTGVADDTQGTGVGDETEGTGDAGTGIAPHRTGATRHGDL